jgi:hypothetical protein
MVSGWLCAASRVLYPPMDRIVVGHSYKVPAYISGEVGVQDTFILCIRHTASLPIETNNGMVTP